jgi:serine protease Do
LTAGGLVVAIVAAATGLEAIRNGYSVEQPGSGSAVEATTVTTAPAAQSSQSAAVTVDPTGLSRAFRYAAQRATPSVVYIEVQTQQRVVQNPFWPFDNPTRQPRIEPGRGAGSGVIEGATRVTVALTDGRQYQAEVVGRDPTTDVALIKVNATGLPAAEIGDSDQMEVGDWVVALGNPLSLRSTATAGIVSAKGRNLGIIRRNPSLNEETRDQALEHFIQTDAAINPGNSGGALVSLDGRVIGINTAIASQTGLFEGYGFAIPINIAKRVAEDLMKYGEFRRPRLGVGVQDLDQADVEVYKLQSAKGAEVIQVDPGSAAGRAGIELGDVIVRLDGTQIEDGGHLTELLARYEPGQTVTLDVLRYGRPMKFQAKLGAFESPVRAERTASAPRERGMSRLGFRAQELTAQLAAQYQIQEARGVVITEVDPSSGAPGIEGFVIEKLNGQEIRTLADLDRAANRVQAGAAVSLVVRAPNGTQRIVNYRVTG